MITSVGSMGRLLGIVLCPAVNVCVFNYLCSLLCGRSVAMLCCLLEGPRAMQVIQQCATIASLESLTRSTPAHGAPAYIAVSHI